MRENRDIRIYEYDYASMKKAKYKIKGHGSIHKASSVIIAMQLINYIRAMRPQLNKVQFIIIDFTEKAGGVIKQVY